MLKQCQESRGRHDGYDAPHFEVLAEPVVVHKLPDRVGVGRATGLNDDGVEWAFRMHGQHFVTHDAQKVACLAFAKEAPTHNAVSGGSGGCERVAVDAGLRKLVDEKQQTPIGVRFRQAAEQGRLTAAEKAGN